MSLTRYFTKSYYKNEEKLDLFIQREYTDILKF